MRDGNIPRRSVNIGRYPAKSRARGVAGCVHDDAGGRNAPAPVPGTAPGPARWSAEVIPRSCGVSRKPICLPAPCISRLAPNARENGMFSRPRICLTRISRIDRMGQQLAPTLNCALLDWFTRLKSGSIYSLDGNIRHDLFSLYFCRNIAPGEPFSLGVYALHSIGKHGQDSGRRDPRVHHQPRQGGPRTDLQEEGSSCGASGACHPKKPRLSRD